MLLAVAVHTTVDVRGVSAVVQVVSPGCGQYGLELLGPLLVGPGHPPHLIGRQAEIAEHQPERLATTDGVQELMPYVGGSRACAF